MKILLAGEGGQGVQVAAEILAKAAFYENKSALYIPNFGVEQRGGVSLAFVVVNQKPVVYPKFEQADILAIFSDRSYERVRGHFGSKTKIFLGPVVTKKIRNAIKLKANNLPNRTWNVLILGKINQTAKLVSEKNLIRAMEERFARQYQKNPELKKLNLKALKNV